MDILSLDLAKRATIAKVFSARIKRFAILSRMAEMETTLAAIFHISAAVVGWFSASIHDKTWNADVL